uniref:Uncharacterized protein n=1 Tax=Gossypium raimondii TaxID=29730 RepID=A0A0D2RTF3_GOSRA|nr:hypothetical protein B456_011G265800 [Gossypium raimondii]
MFHEVEVRRSLPVTLNDRDWPTKMALDCQFWPQFLLMLVHSVFDPLTLAFTISLALATFVIRAKLKYRKPLIVNLIPPRFRHGTLKNHTKKEMKIGSNLLTLIVEMRLSQHIG